MFIKKSFEQDLSQGMEQNLVSNAKEEEFKFTKLARALELVNRAAATFDQAGHTEASDALMLLLEKLASTNPEQEVKNLLETGTMFPASDFKENADDTASAEDDNIDIDEKDLKDLESMFEDEE